MVLSRWPWRLAFAAATNMTTSASVRCSPLGRSTLLGRRSGLTARLSVGGDTSLRFDFVMFGCLENVKLLVLLQEYEQFSRAMGDVTPLLRQARRGPNPASNR